MTRLQDQAMIAELHQRAWSARATDKNLAEEIEDAKEAESGSMRVIKELAPRQYISPIRSIMRLGKAEHDRVTVAGFMRGQSLLATANFQRYALFQSTIKDEFYKAVDRFVEIYPRILSTAEVRLGMAYREADFPTHGQIRDYFEYENKFRPIPSTSDWRLDGIANEQADDMREQIENEVKTVYNEATKEVFRRARTTLENIAKQAKNYGTEKNSSPLRNITIDNLKEMAELVCTMNIANDPLLAEVGRDMVKEFSTVEAADLRKDDDLRQNVASAAERILARFKGVAVD